MTKLHVVCELEAQVTKAYAVSVMPQAYARSRVQILNLELSGHLIAFDMVYFETYLSLHTILRCV